MRLLDRPRAKRRRTADLAACACVRGARSPRPRHPRLVLVRLTGYGPRHGAPGHDLNFMAAAGGLAMSSDPTAPPVRAPLAFARASDGRGGSTPLLIFFHSLHTAALRTAP